MGKEMEYARSAEAFFYNERFKYEFDDAKAHTLKEFPILGDIPKDISDPLWAELEEDFIISTKCVDAIKYIGEAGRGDAESIATTALQEMASRDMDKLSGKQKLVTRLAKEALNNKKSKEAGNEMYKSRIYRRFK